MVLMSDQYCNWGSWVLRSVWGLVLVWLSESKGYCLGENEGVEYVNVFSRTGRLIFFSE